jgi:hypothetical protein
MKIRLAVLVLAFAALHALPTAARTPTNDAAAFRTFDLYSDRAAAVATVDHLNFSSYYPSYLISPAYMVIHTVAGVPDTIALLHLQPNDATGMEANGNTPMSYAEYAVVPPLLATSISVSVNADVVFAGFGQYYDFLKPLATITVTYEDASTWMDTLLVGQHIRTWLSGSITCLSDLWYTYNTPPFDQYAVPLYASGGVFMDMQEVRLPRVPKKITLIRVQAIALDHFCSIYNPHLYAGYHLHAVALWPNFRLTKVSGADSVGRVSQTTGHHHGGYLFGTDVVGWRRNTDETGCKITSLSVAYTYAGFNCSVDSLNAFLQRSEGYKPSQVCVIESVAPDGSSVTFKPLTADDTRLRNGDTFLVERGIRTNPLATYQVDSPGHAFRLARHNQTTIPAKNDVGRVYWNSIPTIADKYTHPGLRSVFVPDTPQAAAIVESLLVRDIPVQLNVGPFGGHWVVADGMTSSFRPDNTARGTYSIKDPYDDRNYTKLIEGQYRNTFTQARFVVPTGLPLLSSPFTVTSDPPGLSILADGARRVEIVDPLGRHMMRDATTGEGVYDIPDASIEDVSGEHDNGGSVDIAPTAYDIEVPTTVDGHYTVNVYSNVGLSLSASGYDGAGVFATDIVADTTGGAIGSTYDILYSFSAQSVTISYSGALGVETVPVISTALRVRRSPVSGPVEFLVLGGARGADVIEIFDVGGRRVGRIDVGSGLGTQTATWDWRTAGCQPGVYLARLRSGAAQVARFVVLH